MSLLYLVMGVVWIWMTIKGFVALFTGKIRHLKRSMRGKPARITGICLLIPLIAGVLALLGESMELIPESDNMLMYAAFMILLMIVGIWAPLLLKNWES